MDLLQEGDLLGRHAPAPVGLVENAGYDLVAVLDRHPDHCSRGLAGAGAGYRGDFAGRSQDVPGLAGQLQPHRLPAVAVPQHDLRAGRIERVPVAPLHQRHQDRVQIQALAGQPVLVSRALAGVPVGDLAQQILAHQACEPVAEHLPGHSGAAPHVIEPAHAVEGLAQHEERRALPDDVHRRADRAVGRVVVHDPGPCHGHMLNPVDRLSNSAKS